MMVFRYSLSIALVSFAIVTLSSNARPISYVGGTTFMQTNNWEKNRLHYHYTHDVNNSFGMVLEYEDDTNRQNLNGQWNHLFARSNTRTSQANLYLKSQLGIAKKGGRYAPNTEVGLAGDWETRKFFTSYAVTGRYANGIDDGSFHQKGRVGIAPYVAGYGELHTWLMLQLEHHPESFNNDEKVILTPLVRLFKGDYLVELGINNNGGPLLNWTARF
tara:strand:- start:1256 stop:1906 length:651 start_codon:yes stop_codon:yes gene_type:complete